MSDDRFPNQTGLEHLRRNDGGKAGCKVRPAFSQCIQSALVILACICLLPGIPAATLGGADLPKAGETLTLTNDTTLRILAGESALFRGMIEVRGWNLQFSLINEGTLVASNGIVTVSGGPLGRAAILSVGRVMGSSLQVNAFGASKATVDLAGSVTLEDMILKAQLDGATNELLTVSTHASDFRVSRVVFISNGSAGGIRCDVEVNVGQTFLVNEWQNAANYGGSITHRFCGEGAVLLRQAGYAASGWSHGIESSIRTECDVEVTIHCLSCYGVRVPPVIFTGSGQVYATNTVSFWTLASGALRVVPQPVLLASPASSRFMNLQASACLPEITYWIERSTKLPADTWVRLVSFSDVAGTNFQVDVRAEESAFYRCRFE